MTAAFLLLAAAFCAQAAQKPAAEGIKALSLLPRSELAELKKLYDRYADVVAKRTAEGWRAGLESGDLIEHPQEARLPTRQLEEAAAKRSSELKRLSAERDKETSEPRAARLDAAIAAKQAELKKLRKQLARSQGTCADWSDMVWADLLKVEVEGWDLRDTQRSARPWHTATVACSPAGAPKPTVCLAFDPWRRGEPDVYEFFSWDDGSFEGRLPAEFFLHQLPESADS
jgi:hypothetical protein